MSSGISSISSLPSSPTICGDQSTCGRSADAYNLELELRIGTYSRLLGQLKQRAKLDAQRLLSRESLEVGQLGLLVHDLGVELEYTRAAMMSLQSMGGYVGPDRSTDLSHLVPQRLKQLSLRGQVLVLRGSDVPGQSSSRSPQRPRNGGRTSADILTSFFSSRSDLDPTARLRFLVSSSVSSLVRTGRRVQG